MLATLKISDSCSCDTCDGSCDSGCDCDCDCCVQCVPGAIECVKNSLECSSVAFWFALHSRIDAICSSDCVARSGARGLRSRVSCMNGNTTYMAENRARDVGNRRESLIRTRAAAGFFLVRPQPDDDRNALEVPGGRLDGVGV